MQFLAFHDLGKKKKKKKRTSGKFLIQFLFIRSAARLCGIHQKNLKLATANITAK